MSRRRKGPYRVRPACCKTCMFGGPDPVQLAPGRTGEILRYTLTGRTHLCHTPGPGGRPNELAYRGARDILLRVLCSQGAITEPTDAALAAAMRTAGVEPPPD